MSSTDRVLAELDLERRAQDAQWGEQNHPDYSPRRNLAQREGLRDMARRICDDAARAGLVTWAHILDEEIAEAYAETDPAKIRAELVQAGAVIVAWIECIDRRSVSA